MDELLPEYDLDYRKARPNRYAGKIDKSQVVVMLEPNIAEVFATPESVNAVLTRPDFDHACHPGETCPQVILSAGSTTASSLTGDRTPGARTHKRREDRAAQSLRTPPATDLATFVTSFPLAAS